MSALRAEPWPKENRPVARAAEAVLQNSEDLNSAFKVADLLPCQAALIANIHFFGKPFGGEFAGDFRAV